jgi:hypothetical protein
LFTQMPKKDQAEDYDRGLDVLQGCAKRRFS